MSKLTEALERLQGIPRLLSVWDEVKDEVREIAPDLYRVLDALARDDYEACAKALLALPFVVAIVAEAAKRVDLFIPGERLLSLMERAGLKPDEPAPAQAPEA